MKKPTVRDIGLVASLAALYAASAVLPDIPIVGAPGGKISLSVVLAPVYALLLGPYLGPLTILIGSVLAPEPKSFGGLMVIPPVLGAMVTSLAVYRGRGWAASSALLAALIAGWYATWVGRNAPLYPIPHIIALLIPLTFQGRLASWLQSDKKRLAAAVSLSSYAGIMTDHMTGNIIFIQAIGWLIPLEWVNSMVEGMGLPSVPALFMYMLPISMIERLSMTAASAAIGIPLLLTLRASGLLPERW